jgi:pimeloyl-ACP methyl ester carboxylesterase
MLLPPYHRRTLTLPDGATISSLRLGDGPLPFLLIPGGSDGWATVGESARLLAWLYRSRVKTHCLLLLSRRHPIPARFTLEQYAADFLWAMEQLGWDKAILECNSAGGPIGQLMAVKAPQRVIGLVLQCTAHRTDDQARTAIRFWARLAQQRRWPELMWSAIEHGIHPTAAAHLRAWRSFRPLLRLTRPPRHVERLSRVFEGLLEIDNRPILSRIACPTLVIGGEKDRIFSASLQREMAALIPNSRLVLHPGDGHFINTDHRRQVEAFGQAAWQLSERSTQINFSGNSLYERQWSPA